MTRLPHDSWNVKPRPDLEPYELNTACAVCQTTRSWPTGRLEDHHIWRKSFDPGMRDAWWVEIPDLLGIVVPNRVALCNDCHTDITENRTRIRFENDIFYLLEPGQQPKPLIPQPGPEDRLGHQTTVTGEWKTHEDVVAELVARNAQAKALQPGHTCPTCKRRKSFPKKDSSPADTKRVGVRAPIEFAKGIEAQLSGFALKAGVYDTPFGLAKAVSLALFIASEVPRETLEEIVKEMTWA